MFDFSTANGNRRFTLVSSVHTGVGINYCLTQVGLDTAPLDYTPQEP